MSKFGRLEICLTLFIAVVSSPTMAIEPARPVASAARVQQVDVALDAGVFQGKLMSAEGEPLASRPLMLTDQQGRTATTTTDWSGEFQFQSLTPGQYYLRLQDQTAIIRAWLPRAAPPQAKSMGLFVLGEALRGQAGSPPPGHFDGALIRALRNPWFVGGVTAAAIAIPLAIDNHDAS